MTRANSLNLDGTPHLTNETGSWRGRNPISCVCPHSRRYVGCGLAFVGCRRRLTELFIMDPPVVTLRERGSYQAILAAIVGGCAIIGPFLGGGGFSDRPSAQRDTLTPFLSFRSYYSTLELERHFLGRFRAGTSTAAIKRSDDLSAGLTVAFLPPFSMFFPFIYQINLPAGALAGVGIFFFLRVPPPPDRSFKAMLKRVDWGGLVLCIASVVLFLLGLTWAAPYGWVSGQCLGPLIGGVVLGGVFVLYEAKVPAEPNVPLRLFKNRNYSLVVTAMFMLGYGMTGGSFWVPQFFQDAQGADATTAGVRSLAYMGPFIPVSLTCGILSSRFGVYIPFPKVGLAIAAVASGLLSLWNASTPYIPSELGYLLMLGAGFGMSNSMLMLANQVNCDVKDIGPGTTVGTFMRTIGGTMGIGVGGAVLGASIASTFSPTYIAELAGQWGVSTEVAGALVRSLLAGTPPPSGVDPGVVTAADMAVKEAYGSAYSKVFLSFAPVVAVGWLAALAITHVPLRGSGGPKKEESKDKDTKEEAANGNGESKEGNESVFVIEDV